MRKSAGKWRHIFQVGSLLVLFAALILSGCGSSGGGGGGGTPVQPAITMQSSLTSGSQLAQGGTTTITATVVGENGARAADGTEVLFSSSTGFITPSVQTVGGKAVATFNAASAGGPVTITATSGGLSSTFSLNIASGAAASIGIKSVTPSRLGLRGTGTSESGLLVFTVKDGNGNLVADGTQVNFALNAPTGGGEALTASSAFTVGGDVSVTLQSGTVAGVATVTASTGSGTSLVSTQARVTMGYGVPDQLHIGLAFGKLNVPGRKTFGIENSLTAYVADRFSNPVPAGTPVYFASECGIVALSDGQGVVTNLTNNFGIASATSVTAAPADSLCRMIMWTEGEEAYTDTNGNGRYDLGEPHIGIGEPFIDANDNGSYNLGETYFDLDGSLTYTPANTVWSGDTFVWTSGLVRWSGQTAAATFSPSTFAIAPGASQNFTISVTDVFGGPLTGGSTVKISTTCDAAAATLSGQGADASGVSIPDSVSGGSGISTFNVSLTSKRAAGATVAPCTLKVDVTSAGNGNQSTSISGTL